MRLIQFGDIHLEDWELDAAQEAMDEFLAELPPDPKHFVNGEEEMMDVDRESNCHNACLVENWHHLSQNLFSKDPSTPESPRLVVNEGNSHGRAVQIYASDKDSSECCAESPELETEDGMPRHRLAPLVGHCGPRYNSGTALKKLDNLQCVKEWNQVAKKQKIEKLKTGQGTTRKSKRLSGSVSKHSG